MYVRGEREIDSDWDFERQCELGLGITRERGREAEERGSGRWVMKAAHPLVQHALNVKSYLCIASQMRCTAMGPFLIDVLNQL
jgi:hypothetical protein